VGVLQGNALRGRQHPFALRCANEGAVLLAVPAVLTGRLDFVRQRLILVLAHLERGLAGRTFAPELAVLVERMDTEVVKASSVCSMSPTPRGLR
jgi:hypothetical protein